MVDRSCPPALPAKIRNARVITNNRFAVFSGKTADTTITRMQVNREGDVEISRNFGVADSSTTQPDKNTLATSAISSGLIRAFKPCRERTVDMISVATISVVRLLKSAEIKLSSRFLPVRNPATIGTAAPRVQGLGPRICSTHRCGGKWPPLPCWTAATHMLMLVQKGVKEST